MKHPTVKVRDISSYSDGFTLVEILIFTAISLIVFVAMITVTVTMIRQSRISIHKLYATHYAQSLQEWLRFTKDQNWQTFYEKTQDPITGSGKVYCVNDNLTLASTLDALNETCDYSGITDSSTIPKIFKRSVTFSTQPDNTKSVKATIRMEWKDFGSEFYSVSLESLFVPL